MIPEPLSEKDDWEEFLCPFILGVAIGATSLAFLLGTLHSKTRGELEKAKAQLAEVQAIPITVEETQDDPTDSRDQWLREKYRSQTDSRTVHDGRTPARIQEGPKEPTVLDPQ